MKFISALLLVSIVVIDASNPQTLPQDILSKHTDGSKDDVGIADGSKTNLRNAGMNKLACVGKGQSNPNCEYDCCEGLKCRTPDGFDESFKACQFVIGRKPTSSVAAGPNIVEE